MASKNQKFLTLSEWLGNGGDKSKNYREWWLLPSQKKARIHIPTDKKAWSSALQFINSPYKRFFTRVSLNFLSLLGFNPSKIGVPDCRLDQWLEADFGDQGPFLYAVYVGTECVFSKDTVKCMDRDGNVIGYVKIPRTTEACEMVRNEADTLERLAKDFPNEHFYPKVLYRSDGLCLQGSASGMAKASSPFEILEKLQATVSGNFSWKDSPVQGVLEKAARELEGSCESVWAALLVEVDSLFRERFGSNPLVHPLSHGDFIKWNIMDGNFAFDWEWASLRLPLHDYFHYTLMPTFVRGSVPDLKLAMIACENEKKWDSSTLLDDDLDIEACLLSYVASQLAFYASASFREGKCLSDIPVLRALRDSLRVMLKSSRSGGCSQK